MSLTFIVYLIQNQLCSHCFCYLIALFFKFHYVFIVSYFQLDFVVIYHKTIQLRPVIKVALLHRSVLRCYRDAVSH